MHGWTGAADVVPFADRSFGRSTHAASASVRRMIGHVLSMRQCIGRPTKDRWVWAQQMTRKSRNYLHAQNRRKSATLIFFQLRLNAGKVLEDYILLTVEMCQPVHPILVVSACGQCCARLARFAKDVDECSKQILRIPAGPPVTPLLSDPGESECLRCCILISRPSLWKPCSPKCSDCQLQRSKLRAKSRRKTDRTGLRFLPLFYYRLLEDLLVAGCGPKPDPSIFCFVGAVGLGMARP